MVSLRPAATFRAGSNDAGFAWGPKEILKVSTTALEYRVAGNFAAAENEYQEGYRQAQRHHDSATASLYLTAVGTCRLMQFHYRAALESYLEAKQIAQKAGDRLNLGAIASNLSSLYQQVGDIESALREGEEARAAIEKLPPPYYKATLLLQLARLQMGAENNSAVPLLEEAIEAARAQGYVALEARAWDLLGEERLRLSRWREAEQDLDEAFRLRVLLYPQERGFSYGRLGALKLVQGQLDLAAAFTARSLAEGARVGMSWPEYRMIHQRGQIKLARGNVRGALQDFRTALDLAATWRQEVLPAVSSRDGANELLEKSVFDSFIETGAAEAIRTGSSRWIDETFQALESNRSESLRESLALADASREKLGPEYWDAVGELRAEESRSLGVGLSRNARTEYLKLIITEMEAKAGLGFPMDSANKGENFGSQSSLIHFREGLGEAELLLSFHVGEPESYRWTVTRESVSLHRLPGAKRIRSEVGDFRDAIRDGRTDAGQVGERLYRELFGDLTRQEAGKQAWLLSLEDSLFELPFAALVTERRSGKVEYLVERHSLQIVPGAFSLNSRHAGLGTRGWLLGVGDPIYNTADPRWVGARPHLSVVVSHWVRPSGTLDPLGQLSRLVASGSEIESSARGWSHGPGDAILLRGADARREEFLKLAAAHPSVIHLATHVVSSGVTHERGGQAFIAFGLDKSLETEFLATSGVAQLHVPGAVVVMTGCSTGEGEARAGTGLLGLTRAWLLAGAGAVLATGWPVKDSSGDIFTSFYGYLRVVPAAEALRRGQIEMIRSSTWRAAPEYWASYQVTGGAH